MHKCNLFYKALQGSQYSTVSVVSEKKNIDHTACLVIIVPC